MMHSAPRIGDASSSEYPASSSNYAKGMYDAGQSESLARGGATDTERTSDQASFQLDRTWPFQSIRFELSETSRAAGQSEDEAAALVPAGRHPGPSENGPPHVTVKAKAVLRDAARVCCSLQG